MKIGLIARGEDRGLGILTWEFYRHLEPDRTLLVEMGELARGFTCHYERYPDAQPTPFNGHSFGDESVIRQWLAGLDVVYSAETFYDWRIVDIAREMGVATVLHVMPEFYRYNLDPSTPRPTMFWTPTTWRLDTLDPATVVVPIPIALDRFTPRQRREGKRFLHIAGHRAAMDRAGTTILLRAMRKVTSPIHLVMVTQDENLPGTATKRGVQVERRTHSKVDYWQLYDDADVLLSPRRYGGLSLPHNEAAGAGLGLVLSDAEPNRTTWPGRYVQCEGRGEIGTQGGPVTVWNTDPDSLAVTIEDIANSPSLTQDLSAASICWAQVNSWTALAGLYLTRLQEAIGVAARGH